MCSAQGFYPQIRHEVRHWLSVVSLVSQGMGVAVVPAALARSGMAGAAFRPLAGTAVRSEVYCVWKTAPDHPARDNFVAMAAAQVASKEATPKEKATGTAADGL
ncbi:DNA-binding transcriptional activator XapR [compost metagenome]